MNRQKLTELLLYPEKLTARETAQLTDMAAQYPFASVIRILLAKSKQQQPDARDALATAALFSPNRHVLRQVMEDKLPPLSSTKTDANLPAPQADKPYEIGIKSPSGLTATEPEADKPPHQQVDIFEELQKNLKRLREERNKLYAPAAEKGKSAPAPEVPGSTDLPASNSPANNQPETASSQSTNEIAVEQQPQSPTIQQIIAEHQPLALDNPRIMEQRNLIDSFLVNAPSLPRRTLQDTNNAAPAPDLTEGMSQTPLDLATETLAKIMERQGKTEKAIDIYQKLLLKYPQKSAYFADCIEQLKKNS